MSRRTQVDSREEPGRGKVQKTRWFAPPGASFYCTVKGGPGTATFAASLALRLYVTVRRNVPTCGHLSVSARTACGNSAMGPELPMQPSTAGGSCQPAEVRCCSVSTG